jgi:hypothetical protein
MKLTTQDYTKLIQVRWLQVTELAIKYSNDAEYGGIIRELTKKTN